MWHGIQKQRLNAIFIDELHPFIRCSMHTYRGAKQNSTLHNLALRATSLVKLGENAKPPTSRTQDEILSRPRSSNSPRVRSGISPVMTVG